eukprot:CAMPEP_0184333682 /NCGR_PEP_ID=MMETSP1089-20130417/2631_1 /TAXON_ID=38269 ORGANISM="Gloeochaete wittrockiana, Strain SAG46.84" /NCGR_SAMPLE_ID=MMETSP1089 /ASSEMBLY_ACC=CAM_ASM_000445 /LENGTH=513 /DNA_ID=CAMNT_0026657609 /DNA_START=47 /DNA_END=1588 /DNA_ORIENTATION=+
MSAKRRRFANDDDDEDEGMGMKQDKMQRGKPKNTPALDDGDVEMGAEFEGDIIDNPEDIDEEVFSEDEDPDGTKYEAAVIGASGKKQVWRPGVDELGADEELDYDSSTYEMFHRLHVEWPCLSFDIIRDNLGIHRTKYPHTCFFVSGTQASDGHNSLLVMKASDLHRTKHDGSSSDDEEAENDNSSDEEDHYDDDPVLEHKFIQHPGVINRIRTMPQKTNIVSSWSEDGSVYLWNVQAYVRSLNEPGIRVKNCDPLFKFSKHSTEGFAMDWSTVAEGKLVTGDCDKNIYLWEPTEGGSWSVSDRPFAGHSSSIEDLQWSPIEPTIFASCSSDKTIKIWDTRARKAAISFKAHKADVNVISWNRLRTFMLVSGADDGTITTWDMREFPRAEPQAHFKWHKGPVTSIEWSPEEESVLAAASSDNTITIWDLALENEEMDSSEPLEVPPQLLFEHQGVEDPKEIHWHPQIPGVIISTSANGFCLFKTINSSITTAEPETDDVLPSSSSSSAFGGPL